MLHSLKPTSYAEGERLAGACNCPNCQESFVFANGHVMLVHYRMPDKSGTPQLMEGLAAFCSLKCILDFENSQFMGKC